ncbi:MAG: hypothetical protein ACP5N6_15070 [Anaerolineae bacterium]|uniref:hypothetical protein n=1 Tax=Thermanaerothrix sp. TaxID=2972675 RepID=UPI003C7E39FD
MMNITTKMVGPNRWLLLTLGLALTRGMIYASSLPPWGLNDEQQHFHYIQSVCETGSIPTVGKDYISAEIAISSYQTKRHEVFHWPPYPSIYPQDWGLEGHSYEGYQPPLYYLALAPLYIGASLISSDILVKLQILKWSNVVLSLTTLCLLYYVAMLLFPQRRFVPFLLCSLLVWWPERIMATSRVNNDVLTEVLGAALYVLLVKSALRESISKRDSLLIGMVFGLGLLTKWTFLPWIFGILYVFWLHRKAGFSGLLLAIGISLVMVMPYALRNFLIYGDPTGFSSFQQLAGPVSAPERTLVGFVRAVVEFLMYLWVVWWKGATAGGNPLTRSAFYAYFILFYSLIGFGLSRFLKRYKQIERSTKVLFGLNFVTVGAFFLSIMSSYYAGRIPILQGRFMLPAALPLFVLLTSSLLQFRQGGKILALFSLSLGAIDIAQLFVNLLPYFYYWSAFVGKAVTPPGDIFDGWCLFIVRFLADKPGGLQWLIIGLIIVYISLSVRWVCELKKGWHAWN